MQVVAEAAGQAELRQAGDCLEEVEASQAPSGLEEEEQEQRLKQPGVLEKRMQAQR